MKIVREEKSPLLKSEDQNFAQRWGGTGTPRLNSATFGGSVIWTGSGKSPQSLSSWISGSNAILGPTLTKTLLFQFSSNRFNSPVISITFSDGCAVSK